MEDVKVRKAKPKLLRCDSDDRINVCAYCRVSTDADDQRNSLEAQKEFFNKIFEKHSKWENAGIFADKGISGTSLEKRDQFNEMITKAKSGKIDLIYTKEVSRFARNVQDLLNTVDALRKINVFVIFLTDEINTECDNYRERLSQIATNAEIESLKTSRRVKWGQAASMNQGVVFGRREMFGYNIVKDENGKQHFEIIDEEAETVRFIFEEFSKGIGTYRISKKLQERGITTKRYKNGWSNTVILRILRNEKYVGDLLQGKTYTPDALTHKKKYNKENSDMYYIRDHHPESAIIDRELWDKVQIVLQEKSPDEKTKAKYSNRYWCSGKIYCENCGSSFVSRVKKQKTGIYKSWICFEHNQRGIEKEITVGGNNVKVGCDSKPINEKILKQALYDIITQVIIPNKEKVKKEIKDEIKKPTKRTDIKKGINQINNKISKIESEYAKLTIRLNNAEITEVAYGLTSNEYEKQLSELKLTLSKLYEQEKNSLYENNGTENYLTKLDEILSLSNDKINEELYERIVKKIIVYNDKTFEIFLSFLPRPIKLRYEAHGKVNTYNVNFTVLTDEKNSKNQTKLTIYS